MKAQIVGNPGHQRVKRCVAGEVENVAGAVVFSLTLAPEEPAIVILWVEALAAAQHRRMLQPRARKPVTGP
jgi:signal recognition particle receptor subunit beta